MKKLLTILLFVPMLADAHGRYRDYNHVIIPLGALAAGAIIYNTIQEDNYREYQVEQYRIENEQYRMQQDYKQHLNDCQYFLNTRQYRKYDYYCNN